MTVTIIAPDPKVAPARARTSAMVSPCLSRAISPGFDTAPRTATVLLRYSVTSTLTEGCRNTPTVLSARSEERRVGKECVSTCRYRGVADHSTKQYNSDTTIDIT